MSTPSNTLFNRTSALNFFRAFPRFGHTNDISTIASTAEEDTNDYEKGILFVPLFFVMLFSLWIIIIVALKCLGPKDAGFLSGHSFLYPEGAKRDSRRPLVVRALFLFFSVLLVIFSVLLIVKGCGSLERTTNQFKSEVLDLLELTKQALFYIETLVGIGETSAPKLDQLLVTIDPSIDLLTGFVSASTIQEIKDISRTVAQTVAFLLTNFMKSTFSEITVALENLSEDLDGVYKTTNDVDPVLWSNVITYFFIPVLILTSFLSTGTVMALLSHSMTKVQSAFQSFNTYVILPLFATAIIICAIFVTVLGPAGILNADICAGNEYIEGPEGTILNVLREQRIDENNRLYLLAAHYLSACVSQFPFTEIQSYDAALDDARLSVGSYKILIMTAYEELQLNGAYNLLMETVPEELLQQLPGDFNFTAFPILLDDVIEEFDKLLNSTREALDLVGCENISMNYYSPMVHDVFCTDLISTFAWMFSSLLIISISGFFMITLRAAWKKDKTFSNKNTDFEVISPKIP